MRIVLRMAAGLRGIGARLGMALVVGVALSVVGVSSTAEEVWAQTMPDPALAGGFTEAEKEALEAIYNATDGANWTNKTNWMSDKPLGEWFGVHDSVETEPGIEVPAGFHGSQNPPQKRVYALRLPNNNLKGTLPDDERVENRVRRYTEEPSLNNLSRLRVLDLSGNELTGNPPNDIGNLRHLKVLLLQNNKFDGALPPRWDFGVADTTSDTGDPDNFPYSNIQTINLTNSGISRFSSGIANKLQDSSSRRPWQQLRHLYWAQADFRSVDMRGEELGNLPNLEVLDLSRSRYVEELHDDLADLESLRELYLYGTSEEPNNFDGKLIPDAWAASGKLPNLEVLELQGNKFEEIGALAAFVKDRPNLKVLRLENNGELAAAALPAELAAHAGLEVLRMEGNGLTGDLPADWNASELKVLRLDNNELTGAVPASLASAGKLEVLHLNGNNLNEAMPLDWSAATALKRVRLDNNELTGFVPGTFVDLPELRMLMLHRNMLSGSLPRSFGVAGKFPKLETFTVDHNDLTGTVPAGFLQLDSAVFLSLTHNGFSGIDGAIGAGTGTALEELLFEENELTAVPANLTRSSGLKRLSFNYNEITGDFPSQIGSLSGLTELYMNDNEFTGTIPSGLGSASGMLKMNLGENALTGGIPMELGSLSNLTELHLYGNELSGAIPMELGGLDKVEILNLSGNQLTSMPSELASLDEVVEFDLSDNALTGTIQGNFKTGAPKLEKLYLNNNQLTGGIPDSLFHDAAVTKLKELNLGHNQLTGSIRVEGIANIATTAERILLNNNMLDGTISNQLVGFTRALRRLDLSHNQFTSITNAAVNEFGPTVFEELNLHNNMFTGRVPSNLDRYGSLMTLTLRNNMFDCIPAGLLDGTPPNLDEHGLAACQ